MGEIYKQILNYDYEFSNYGNIRNIKTKRIKKHQQVQNKPQKYVNLQVNGKPSKFYIHQLFCIFYRDGFEKCDYSYEAVMALCEINKQNGKPDDENNEKNIYRINKNKIKKWKVLIEKDDYKISATFANLQDAIKFRDDENKPPLKIKTENEELIELEKELQALINN